MARSEGPNLWRLASMGLELGGAVVVLALVGWFADRQLGTSPWGLILGFLLGFVGGMYLFLRHAIAANRESMKR